MRFFKERERKKRSKEDPLCFLFALSNRGYRVQLANVGGVPSPNNSASCNCESLSRSAFSIIILIPLIRLKLVFQLILPLFSTITSLFKVFIIYSMIIYLNHPFSVFQHLFPVYLSIF